MPILLYCITKSRTHNENSISGVAGDAVIREDFGGLAVFTSLNSDSRLWLQRELRTSAIEFHRVVKQIFKSEAIIPFRFPTIFEAPDDLAKHLQQRGTEYEALLTKFEDMVQMELKITQMELPRPSESGTDYLKNRRDWISTAERACNSLSQTLSPYVQDWRRRELKDGVRAFALVKRSEVAEFENALRNAAVPRGFNVRVSGPWPVSEFLEIS